MTDPNPPTGSSNSQAASPDTTTPADGRSESRGATASQQGKRIGLTDDVNGNGPPADEEADDDDENAEEEEDSDDEEEEDNDDEDDDDEDDENDEDEEPKLKYARLTQHLSAVYRNGDATSSFIVAGDKMITGTHDGNIVSTATCPCVYVKTAS